MNTGVGLFHKKTFLDLDKPRLLATPRGLLDTERAGRTQEHASGKKVAHTIDDPVKIHAQSNISMEAPHWFHSAQITNPDNYVNYSKFEFEKGYRKKEVHDEATGKVITNATTSHYAPDIMHNPVNNKYTPEEQHLINAQPDKPSGWARKIEVDPDTRTKLLFEQARVFYKTGVHPESPEHFKAPFKNVRDKLREVHGIEIERDLGGRKLVPHRGRPGPVAGFDVDTKKNCKGVKILEPDTGGVITRHDTSENPPYFMESAYTTKEKLPRRFEYAGDIANKYANPFGFKDKGKQRYRVDEDTGRVYNKLNMSPDAPEWMKSPFKSNKEYLEKNITGGGPPPVLRGDAAKAQARTLGDEYFHMYAKKKTTFKDIMTGQPGLRADRFVAPDAPDFMRRTMAETARKGHTEKVNKIADMKRIARQHREHRKFDPPKRHAAGKVTH